MLREFGLDLLGGLDQKAVVAGDYRVPAPAIYGNMGQTRIAAAATTQHMQAYGGAAAVDPLHVVDDERADSSPARPHGRDSRWRPSPPSPSRSGHGFPP